MNIFTTIEEKWQDLCKKTAPTRKKWRKALKKTGKALKSAWTFVYRLRAVFLAVPVAVGAIWLACINAAKLPESVGINLLASGEFSMMVSRGVAVLVPLAITAFCVLLTLGSRKTLYPWMISLFSLALPVLIYVTNLFPA